MKIRFLASALLLAGVAWGGSAQAQSLSPQPFRAGVQGVEALERSAGNPTWDMGNVEAVAKRRKWKKLWIGSMAAFAVVNLVDAHSSQGKREANPLLRNSNGTFSTTKALAIKGGVGAGFFAWQMWKASRHPERNYYKSFAVTNTAVTGGLAAIAVHNYGNGKVN